MKLRTTEDKMNLVVNSEKGELQAALLKRDEEIELKDSKINDLQSKMSELKRISKKTRGDAEKKSARDENLLNVKSKEIQELKGALIEREEAIKGKDAKIDALRIERSELEATLKEIRNDAEDKAARDQNLIYAKNMDIRHLKTASKISIRERDAKIDALQTEQLELRKIMDQILVEADKNLRKKQELVVSKNVELQQIKVELSIKTNELEKKHVEINVVQAELSQLKSKAAAEPTRKTLQGVNQQPHRDEEPRLECPSKPPHSDRNAASLGKPMVQKSGPILHPRAVQTGNPRAEPLALNSTSSKSPPPPGPQSRKSTPPGKQIASASKPAPYYIPRSRLLIQSFADLCSNQLSKKEPYPTKWKPYECEYCPVSFLTLHECKRHNEESHGVVYDVFV